MLETDRMKPAKEKIQSLRLKIQDTLLFTVDRLFTDGLDSYFSIEEQLEEMDRVLGILWEEADRTQDAYGRRKLMERILYMEDCFEELDSKVRGRPRKVRRKFSFFDFFREQSRGWRESESGAVQSEISSSAEAYQILGVQSGQTLSSITAVFRRSVKNLHPDARGGDRSQEPKLRKLIAAYQWIKKELTGR